MNEFLGGEESKFKARDDIPKNGNYGGEWLVLFSDGSVRSYDMGKDKNIFFYAMPGSDVVGYLKKQPGLLAMRHNAPAQADAACGVSPGAIG